MFSIRAWNDALCGPHHRLLFQVLTTYVVRNYLCCICECTYNTGEDSGEISFKKQNNRNVLLNSTLQFSITNSVVFYDVTSKKIKKIL